MMEIEGPFWYKEGLSGYDDFHYKDKTVVKPFYLYSGKSYTGKVVSYH